MFKSGDVLQALEIHSRKAVACKWCDYKGWEQEGHREGEREKHSDHLMASGFAAQFFSGAVTTIHVDIACSVVETEQIPLRRSALFAMQIHE